MTNLSLLYIRALILLSILMAGGRGAAALTVETYAERSVLADGRWVRIGVERSGAVMLTTEALRRMGFSSAENVRIYGYGGARIPDLLDASTFVDDLPQTPSVATPRGVVFYAQGPDEYTEGASGTSRGRITHSLNPFSSLGYYFITERADEPRLEPRSEGLTPTGMGATTFTDVIFHELDAVSMGESGHQLFGEDMRHTRNRTFNFSLPGREEGTEVWVRTTFGASTGYAGTLAIAVNGENDPAPTRIPAATSHTYGNVTAATRIATPSGESLTIGLAFDCQGTVSAAYIDAIDINYTRALALPASGVLSFTLDHAEGSLSGATADTRVWDITNPLEASEMTLTVDGSRASWRNPYGAGRRYIAWRPDATGFASPASTTNIAAQNLHGSLALTSHPDMVIIAPTPFMAQGERIAELHRTDRDEPLTVAVVDASQIYNEFGSGAPDINAIRRMLKMVYDRGAAAGQPLRFALLLGRATFDNRALTSAMQTVGQTLPTWESDESMSLFDSWTSDDILMMLADGSGSRLSTDEYTIAVGRIPAGNVTTLTGYVDKLISYVAAKDDRGWKNRVLLVADDGNNGDHMDQSERQAEAMLASSGGSRLMMTKAYVDAFDIVGGEATGARERQMRMLDDGVVWWNYIGHANPNSMTGDNMLTLNDINNLYLRRLPFLYGATCSFVRWDGPDPSGAEALALNPSGGVIALISATREVYIEQNGYFSNAIGAEAFRRRPDGMLPTVGEFFIAAKNRLASPGGTYNSNKLRYVLLGDPAMRLATPSSSVDVTTIAGVAADGSADEPPTIMARQRLTIEGRILAPDGTPLDDFSGVVGATIHDAEYSTTSQGHKTNADGETRPVTFEEQGDRLFAGRDTIAAGRFTLNVAMPEQVADNYRPAAISLYAVGADGREATGVNRNFYVFGYDESADLDLTPPTIEYAFLNHQSFRDGQAVNPSPMFIAKVSDNEGINLSTAGVGRQMSLTLDGTTPFTDLTQYYTPASDGTNGGTIAYPLSDLADGEHELIFRVYDTSGNVARRAIPFAVAQGLAPTLFEVFSDANPARTEANFFLRHDRPDATLDVTIAIYNLMGHMVWTSTSTDRSDMFLSAPLRWDLRDMGGRRVQRGIYVYRVTAKGPDGKPQSVSGKIAVAAQ